VVWRKPARRRRARHGQVRRGVMASASRDRRTATVTAAAGGDDAAAEFDGYAVELMAEVARALGIHFELFAVPLHGPSSVNDRTHKYGMWSPLVDQLVTEASVDCSRLSYAHNFALFRL